MKRQTTIIEKVGGAWRRRSDENLAKSIGPSSLSWTAGSCSTHATSGRERDRPNPNARRDRSAADKTATLPKPGEKRMASTHRTFSVLGSATAHRIGKVLRNVDDKGSLEQDRLDASTVRRINKTYRRSVSRAGHHDSFLTRFLTRTKTLRENRQLASASHQDSLASTEDDDDLTYIKPNAADAIRALMPFVPRLLCHDIYEAHEATSSDAAATLCDGRFARPSMTKIRGAVMVADVCGFTRLTDKLGKQGRAGVELLTRVINSYLTQAIDIVFAYGGDIIKFAGDSLIVTFYDDASKGTEILRPVFESVVERALKCAGELTGRLGQVQMLPNGEVRPVVRSSSISGGGIREALKRKREVRQGKVVNFPTRPSSSRSFSPPSSLAEGLTTTRSANALSRCATVDSARVPSLGVPSSNGDDPPAAARASGDDQKEKRRRRWRLWRGGFRLSCRPRFAFPSDTEHSAESVHPCREETTRGSVRFSPTTPDNSERLVHRGSSSWMMDDASSMASNISSNFRNVLDDGEMHLKVLVGCGDYCLFRVGGELEGGQTSARWEYIVADHPNATSEILYGHLFRQPLRQIAAIEEYANEEDIVISEEVLKVRHSAFARVFSEKTILRSRIAVLNTRR